MASIRYTSRSLRRRRNTDTWEVVLSHKNPITGEVARTFHSVEGKTKRQAQKARDELILELERKGGAVGTTMTVRQFLDHFLGYKEESGTIEPATVRGYKADSKFMCRYIGSVHLGALNIPEVNKMMADMTADGYAPKSVSKAFRLLKQALKWAQAQDLTTKNPCDFCKPPKRAKTPMEVRCR